ncbi:MAG: YCF48-related protein [Ignavibacteria bacterium]
MIKKNNKCLSYVILVIIFIISNNIVLSQSGWINQSIGTRNYVAINFINETTGFIFGTDGTILRSTDKGNNWNVFINYNFGNPVKTGIAVNENLFCVIIGPSVPLFFGTVYTSTNAGMNWLPGSDIQPIGFGFIWLRGITFIDDNTGYVCGNDYGNIGPSFYVDGIIYKTTNSGVNWFQSSRGQGVDYYDICFNNIQTGYCAWSSVLKTTDEGSSWIYYGEVNAVTFSITPSFNDTMYMCGDSGKVYRSVNGAADWVKYYTPADDTLKKIFFVNSKTGYAAGDGGTIIKTTNAGVNWSLQTSNTTRKLNSICFLNKDTGFAVGDSGVVLRTTTGGLTYIHGNTNLELVFFTLYQNYPNPFNPETIISYQLAVRGFTLLKIFDTSGKEVATLVNGTQNAGTHEYKFSAEDLPSGLYFYTLSVDGKFFDTRLMILIK